MTVEQGEKSRLQALFSGCHGEGRAALIGYLPTGYPDVPTSIAAMKALTESGCDLIEVGVPYSDPGMDGPVIASAAEAALHGGVRVRDTLAAVEAISAAGGRAVVMTYWNPVLRYGVDAFARDLAAAGGYGLITPDLIPDEADEWLAASEQHQARSHLPGRAVIDAPAPGGHGRGVARIRLRGIDDGCDRCPRCGVERRAGIGQPGQRGIRHRRRGGIGRPIARTGRRDRRLRRRCHRGFGAGLRAHRWVAHDACFE